MNDIDYSDTPSHREFIIYRCLFYILVGFLLLLPLLGWVSIDTCFYEAKLQGWPDNSIVVTRGCLMI